VKRLPFFAAALFVAFAARPARAGMILSYQGETAENSSLAGTPIASGTSFTVMVGFSNAYSRLLSGIPYYSVDSIQVEVGGMPYTPTFGPNDYEIALSDTDISFLVMAAFGPYGMGSGFTPAYEAASTPGWSALAPTPTQFTGYLGSWFQPLLTMDTPVGALTLDYTTVVSDITTTEAPSETPEPSALLLGMTGLACIGLARFRRA
jgi:hypothetical protein